MTQPPDYFLPFLYSVETTVLELWKEFRSLNDKDVEYAYEKLKDYYKQISQGKSPEEPETSSERRQALIDELLNVIEEREETGEDAPFINDPKYAPAGIPISSLAAFYTMCFSRLLKSAQLWRKEAGPRGYLGFIKEQVI